MLNVLIRMSTHGHTERLVYAPITYTQDNIMGVKRLNWSMSCCSTDCFFFFLLCTAHLNHWPKSLLVSFFSTSKSFGWCSYTGATVQYTMWWREWNGCSGRVETEWKRDQMRRQKRCAMKERRRVFVFWSDRETPDLAVKTFRPRRFAARERE